MTPTDQLGYCAAALTPLSFLPQAVLTVRARNVAGISLGMYSTFTLGVALWLAYGLALDSAPPGLPIPLLSVTRAPPCP